MPEAAERPVDIPPAPAHRAAVSKKVHKVEEPPATYGAKTAKAAVAAAKPENSGGVRYASPAQARKAAEKVFRVHRELFHRLAQ
jgi:succinyl-CoA synthetase beta subunit